MKKLSEYVEENNKIKSSDSKTKNKEPKNKNKILVMPITRTEEEAIEKKLDQLRFKILGKELTSFKLGSARNVWVPYGIIRYKFEVDRRTMFNRTGKLSKRGYIHYVYDYNEAHPFQYDPVGDDEIILDKIDIEKIEKAAILNSNRTDKEVREQLEWHTQNRVLRRLYGSHGTLILEEEKKFYRAAVELEVRYGKKSDKPNYRYAYLDNYGIDSEHILGMKYRMD